MTPEAAAIAQQLRVVTREYRTTGSAQSQTTMQSLRADLAAMGYTRTRHNPSATAPTSAPTAPGTGTPVATTPTAPTPDATGGTTVASVSGTAIN